MLQELPTQVLLRKTVNVTIGFVNVTDLVKFTIVAQNIGSFNATGVYVLEELDSHLGDYTYVATSGTYDGHKWDIGFLNAGTNATLNITARVIKAGNFTNYVVIKGNDILKEMILIIMNPTTMILFQTLLHYLSLIWKLPKKSTLRIIPFSTVIQ